MLEVDLATLQDKPWRRPGSDLSDWFNYGFDEISWEAYCYRRREIGDLASALKNKVIVCISSIVVNSNAISFFFSLFDLTGESQLKPKGLKKSPKNKIK